MVHIKQPMPPSGETGYGRGGGQQPTARGGVRGWKRTSSPGDGKPLGARSAAPWMKSLKTATLKGCTATRMGKLASATQKQIAGIPLHLSSLGAVIVSVSF
jgi:hypothetical protein